jgi:hypothetical protein
MEFGWGRANDVGWCLFWSTEYQYMALRFLCCDVSCQRDFLPKCCELPFVFILPILLRCMAISKWFYTDWTRLDCLTITKKGPLRLPVPHNTHPGANVDTVTLT